MAVGNLSHRRMGQMASMRERLAANPGRGLGATNAIAAEASRDPAVLRELVEALDAAMKRAPDAERSVVLVRAANALKKVQAARAEALDPFAKKILRAALECDELFARWSLATVVGGLRLTGSDRMLAVELMFEALDSESVFLRVHALQALMDLAKDDAALRRRLRPIVEEFAANGTAAMQARARKLLGVVRQQ